MKVITVKPKSGLKIRNPRDGRPLPADRTTRIEINQYWMRRLKCGDIEECPEDEAATPKKVSKKSAPKKVSDKPDKLGEQDAN